MSSITMPWEGSVAFYPKLYDLLHSNVTSDISMYATLTQESDRILELGVGTGRIAIPLAESGRRVDAIDKSLPMLKHLKDKLAKKINFTGDLRVVMGDMCCFALKSRYSFIYIPFMTFNYLPTQEAQIACLESVFNHLQPSGRLVLELMSLYKEWFYDDGIPRLVCNVWDPSTNTTVRVHRTTRFDAATQIVEHDRLYEFVDQDGLVKDRQMILLRNRFIMIGEIKLLLEKCGFTITNVWGDHNFSRYTKQSSVMIIESQSTFWS